MTPRRPRHFLFLQGPHGPFFARLSAALTISGHQTSRIGFNSGDALFRSHFGGFTRYTGTAEGWEAWLSAKLEKAQVTDIVLYGTTRPVHAQALAIARAAGLTTHIFEEGYLRPWWVTYERRGANATSALMDISVADMEAALSGQSDPPAAAPARWGDTRQHIFWGAVYHAAVLAGGLRAKPFPTHREPGVPAEAAIAIRHLLLSPFAALYRTRATANLSHSGAPYHLVLLQLSHDANHIAASPYPSNEAYLTHVMTAFAKGAPGHHRLVFKAHPLEDGRQPLARTIARIARRLGIARRVHFLSGAKLAPLLDAASSAVTVNSTAAHQALWRGLPVKNLGPAPHAKPEFTSRQSLEHFFATPDRPDRDAYMTFRRYLLATCQIPGGFYATRARRRLLRRATDLVLAPLDPFDALNSADATAQHLRLVDKSGH
ncbi:MAG: capsule biosynthesis protein CapA [Pseudomonadota bacterium]